MYIFLDDERTPDQVVWGRPLPTEVDWQIARNFWEFKNLVDSEIPEFVSFDHDLGQSKDGNDCANYLVLACMREEKKFPKCNVHSMNPVGAARIRATIRDGIAMCNDLQGRS